MNINQVIIGGRLVRDPEKRATVSGQVVCSFTVAVNERYKGKDGAVKENVAFIECEVWGAAAEAVCEYKRKGDVVAVVGKLKQDRWEKDGKAQSKLLVRADAVQWPPAGGERSGEDGGGYRDPNPTTGTPYPEQPGSRSLL